MNLRNRVLSLSLAIGLFCASGCASLFEEPLEPSQHLWSYNPRPTDIQIGMRKETVREAWGEPVHVHTAGSQGEYQKWVYQNPGQGLNEQTQKVIYLERGAVVGWETSESINR